MMVSMGRFYAPFLVLCMNHAKFGRRRRTVACAAPIFPRAIPPHAAIVLLWRFTRVPLDARHGLGVAVVLIRATDQRRDHQRLIHHQAEHDSSFRPTVAAAASWAIIACNAEFSSVASTH